MLKVYNIAGPDTINAKGWYEFTVNAPSSAIVQWSTTGDSFKYAQEKGTTLKVYVDGDTFETHVARIYCNVSTGIGDLGEQVLKNVNMSISPIEAEVTHVSRILMTNVENGIAKSASVVLDAKDSSSVEGITFEWELDSDQLTRVIRVATKTTVKLEDLIHSAKYFIDGARGYVNINVTLRAYKHGCLVSTAQEKIIVPDELIETF